MSRKSPVILPMRPHPLSPALRASSYKSSSGSIHFLRRGSSSTSLNQFTIPETDSSLDNTLKGEFFREAVLRLLIKLRLTNHKLSEANDLSIQNIASALTNSVYLVILGSQKFLLRVFGPNVLHLIDRDYETSVLARLSTHKIGPRLLGQFKNGRIEQWLESSEVTPEEMRESLTCRYIARRMREFHDNVTLLPNEQNKASVLGNIDAWISTLPPSTLSQLAPFLNTAAVYRQWLQGKEGRVVFCHNDLQYGNLLRVKHSFDEAGTPTTETVGDREHRTLAVIDFEYAGPNPRGFDLANHFCEWMADYHTPPTYEMDESRYPTVQETTLFLTEYIMFYHADSIDPIERRVAELKAQVDMWRAASHVQWAIWGLIQSLPTKSLSPVQTQSHRRDSIAREHEETEFSLEFSLGEPAMNPDPKPIATIEEWVDEEEKSLFDYLAYANQRMGLFWGEMLRMGFCTEGDVPETVKVKRIVC